MTKGLGSRPRFGRTFDCLRVNADSESASNPLLNMRAQFARDSLRHLVSDETQSGNHHLEDYMRSPISSPSVAQSSLAYRNSGKIMRCPMAVAILFFHVVKFRVVPSLSEFAFGEDPATIASSAAVGR